MPLSKILVKIFRWLVAVSLALTTFVPIVIAAAFPDLIPKDHAPSTAIKLAFALVYLAICVTSNIGLFRFTVWSRPLFTAAIAIGWIWNVFSFDEPMSQIGAYQSDIKSTCDGALLALIWASPLAERFPKAAWVDRIGGRTLARFFYDRMIAWPYSGRLAVAALCAVIVASAVFLVPTAGLFALHLAARPGAAETMGSFVGLFAVFVSAAEYILRGAVFWLIVAFVLFPLVHFGFLYRGVSSRWAYAAMGAVAPLLLIALIETVAPQITKREVLLLPFFGGVPAGLIFGAIAGRSPRGPEAEASPERRSSGRLTAAGISLVCLLVLGAVCGEAWSVGMESLQVKSELRYRANHLTWPVLCLSMLESVSLIPHPAPSPGGELSVCKDIAMRGDAVAQVMAAKGKFGPVSPADRALWLSKAADQDYEPAIQNLASMLSPMSPDQGVPKDAQKAMQLYLRSAAHGDVLSQVILATAYRRGQGVEVDMIAALMWREVAAVAAEEQPGEFQLRNLRKSYEEFAAKQSSEQVAEAHQRALAYLQTRKW